MIEPNTYVLFDLPGQVELFTVHTIVPDIISSLVKGSDYRLAAIHLVDAHHASDASKFIRYHETILPYLYIDSLIIYNFYQTSKCVLH